MMQLLPDRSHFEFSILLLAAQTGRLLRGSQRDSAYKVSLISAQHNKQKPLWTLGNYLRALTLCTDSPRRQFNSPSLPLRKACRFSEKAETQRWPGQQPCPADGADSSFHTRANPTAFCLMDSDFNSTDGEGWGLRFGLSSCCQNIPSIINSVSSASRFCCQKERVCHDSAHPATGEGLCSLLFITISPTYYVLGTTLKFDKPDCVMASYLHFTGERLGPGEVKNVPKARNWGGGGSGPGTRSVLALIHMSDGRFHISWPTRNDPPFDCLILWSLRNFHRPRCCDEQSVQAGGWSVGEVQTIEGGTQGPGLQVGSEEGVTDPQALRHSS